MFLTIYETKCFQSLHTRFLEIRGLIDFYSKDSLYLDLSHTPLPVYIPELLKCLPTLSYTHADELFRDFCEPGREQYQTTIEEHYANAECLLPASVL